MTSKDEQILLEIKRIVEDVRDQMQELRQGIGFTPNPTEELRLSESYEHPWDKHIREQSRSDRNLA